MSNLITAIDTLTAITSLIVRLAQAQSEVSALIARAQSEGRDLTPAEIAEIRANRHAALARMEAQA